MEGKTPPQTSTSILATNEQELQRQETPILEMQELSLEAPILKTTQTTKSERSSTVSETTRKDPLPRMLREGSWRRDLFPTWTITLNTKVSGIRRPIKDTDTGPRSGQMGQCTKGIGRATRQMVMED